MQYEGQVDLEGVDWHALASQRVTFVRRHLLQAKHTFTVTVLATFIGATETISVSIMSRKSLVCDFAFLPRNPCVPVLQFMSSILAMEHSCVNLFCRMQGACSPAELLRISPESVHMVRCVGVATSLAVKVRFVDKDGAYPWPLTVVGPPEIPGEAQLAVGLKFYRDCTHRLDGGVGRPLRSRTGTDPDAIHTVGILSPPIKLVLTTWTRLNEGHTFDLECGNGHSKRSTTLNKFDIVAARCVNREAKATFQRCIASVAVVAPPPTPPALALQQPPNASRARSYKSVLQLFHKVFICLIYTV